MEPMKPTLLILAAGMGSRYGGLKQLDGVGPHGETIMDYSVFDAMRAGFGKVVFVIRHDFEDEFNKTSAWYDLFLLWKKKNLNDIFYFVITDNKYIKDAINLAFPDCTCLKSCFNSIDKISNFFSNSYINDSTAKLAKIYNSCDINQFNLNVSNFFEEVINLPFIKDIVKEDFKDFSSYFNMDFTLRKNIFSFYFFRDFRKSLIKLANKTEFSSINDFQILLINDIQRFEKRRYCPINEWNQILSILYRDRKDLISKYL